ncbi:50S ribosomal protein L4 [Bacillota bacterium LX-D]|nr:50S ribosomal protein L4 [Bacillota bacterium LX-D]
MPKVAVYNIEGNQVGEMELDDAVFGVPFNEAAVHNAVVMQLASKRLGTHKTKTRAEVSGGGRKPWRQKGTGRARAGSTRSPIWRKGGIVFGPTPRSYAYSIPKKARRVALKSVLSAKVEEGNLIVLDELSLNQSKTKEMVKILNALNAEPKALVVTSDKDENVIKSARNIKGIMPMTALGLNVYDVLNHDKLVITKDAVAKVEEVLG